MAKSPRKNNPFGEMLALEYGEVGDGISRTALTVREELYNVHDVLHGGALFSLVDTCMGRAIYSRMEEQESCATIEIKLNFIRPVAGGRLECETRVVHRGRTTAVLDSSVTCNGKLVAKAQGTYALFPEPIP